MPCLYGEEEGERLVSVRPAKEYGEDIAGFDKCPLGGCKQTWGNRRKWCLLCIVTAAVEEVRIEVIRKANAALLDARVDRTDDQWTGEAMREWNEVSALDKEPPS